MGADVGPGVNKAASSELEIAIKAAPSFYDALKVSVESQVWGLV